MESRILYIFLIIGTLSLQVSGGPLIIRGTCRSPKCENSGPVCAIDESGVPRTFMNKCLAETAGCSRGTFFADVKAGAC